MRRRFRARRRGTILTLVVPILFAFFGIAALVIDLGLARVAQREMQNVADAAALEGLRGRDDPNVPQANRDEQRREAASQAVEDFYTAPGAPNLVLQFSGGISIPGTTFQAAQLLSVSGPIVYQHGLALNLDNSISGDQVAGTFTDDPGITHQEHPDYSRDDFTPADAGNLTAPGFLVRLRRSNEFVRGGRCGQLDGAARAEPLRAWLPDGPRCQGPRHHSARDRHRYGQASVERWPR